MGKKFAQEKMTKAEEYAFKKARLRHPTFLQDLIEKEETAKEEVRRVRKVRRKNNMFLPSKSIVDVEKLSKDATPEKDIKKKIWG